MSFDLTSLRIMLIIAIFWLLAVPGLSKTRDSNRAVVTIFTALIGLNYLLWRFFRTVLPFTGSPVNKAWIYFVFIIEVLAFVEVCIFLLIMSRYKSRSEEADRYQVVPRGTPSVDVFIPTYNEETDVLEKTIYGAKHLDYPNFKVWVLDDGGRSWLKQFCTDCGVGYIARTEHLHAKAGNLNHALSVTSGELFAVLDADFVAGRNFLNRTVGFFTYNQDIGIVQTPQHFFNKDPVQSNLYLDKVWPDEQRLFFSGMAPCRDGWNAAFCCGSCSVIRRKAVEAIGGIPTSSITEDLLTTLCLLNRNYRTVYLNEKLSQGMSADSVKGYFIQRGRWCRGGIQCFFVPEGPLRAKNLSLLQRILFTPYGWVTQPVTRLILLLVPIVYLWTGLLPLYFTSTAELLSYQLPMLLTFAFSMQWLARRKYVPVISTAVGVFSMFRLLPVVISSLVKPFGEPFRVTPKGSGSSSGADWGIFTVAAIMLVMTAGGIVINLVPEHRVLTQMQFFPYSLFWSSINVLMLIICLLICFDTPRQRKEERFIVNEETSWNEHLVVIEDLSVSGCKIRHSLNRRAVERDTVIRIRIPEVTGEVKMRVTNSNQTRFMGAFRDLSARQREELIVKLFTGKYDNEIHDTALLSQILSSLLRRFFGRERTPENEKNGINPEAV
ncbi:MAG: glycosyltransferase [Victivallaceae bacterium]|nr:glycosyltransferase [Victivallaceae bacterium]